MSDQSPDELDKIRLRLAMQGGLEDLCNLFTQEGPDRVKSELALGARVVTLVALKEWFASRIHAGDTSDEIVAVLSANGVQPEIARAVVKKVFDRQYPISRLEAYVKANRQE